MLALVRLRLCVVSLGAGVLLLLAVALRGCSSSAWAAAHAVCLLSTVGMLWFGLSSWRRCERAAAIERGVCAPLLLLLLSTAVVIFEQPALM